MTGNPPRFLVVDDEPDICQIVCRVANDLGLEAKSASSRSEIFWPLATILSRWGMLKDQQRELKLSDVYRRTWTDTFVGNRKALLEMAPDQDC